MSTSGRVMADLEPVRVAVEVGIILQETFREKLSWGARSARRDDGVIGGIVGAIVGVVLLTRLESAAKSDASL